MSKEKNNNIYNNEAYVNEIDKIINEYKNQLAILKDKSASVVQLVNKNNQNIEDNNTIQTSILNSNYCNDDNSFNVQLQNDNLRLQKENTNYKLRNNQLIENLNERENLISQLSEKISFLENEIIEYKNKLIEYEKNKIKEIEEIKNKLTEESSLSVKKINEERNIDRKIIKDFFDFFNKNIDLYNKSQIINCGNSAKIQFDEDNKENKNEKYSSFAISTLNSFINKIIGDNQEMFEELMKYKNIIDKQNNELYNNINNNNQNQNFNIEDIKYENLILKKQLTNLMNNENLVRFKEVKVENELNNNYERVNENNNENFLVEKNPENNFQNNEENFFNQNQFNLNKENNIINVSKINYENNPNKNDNKFQFNNDMIYSINNLKNINKPQKKIKNFSNNTTNNFQNQIKNNSTNQNNNQMKIRSNNEQIIHQSQSFTGFEGPIQRLKMKITELEEKIKSNKEKDEEDN